MESTLGLADLPSADAITPITPTEIPMPFLQILADPGMNYTFNRPLLDGTSPARLKELSAIAPRIKDDQSWHDVWLETARKAEAEKRWSDAASYYHGAEFYMPAGDARNRLYDDFARNWALAMQGVAGYERFKVPYPGGYLPGFRLQAKGKERATFVFNGGYDSFVEEFYAFLLPLTDLGFTVIAFDGPGQGGALRQGIFFEHAWEKPAKALLDYFGLDAVDWLGASCGGYLSIRAAAFEPRIKHIISMPTSYSGLDMTLKQMHPGKAQKLVSLFKAGDRKATEALVAEERLPSSVFDWCVTQGMHITGTRTPFDFLTAIAKHSLDGILQNVKQDILLTEGEQDHLFDIGWMHRAMREMVCAQSVTARVFTAREGAEQHCQLGNSAAARDEIVFWLSRFYPGMQPVRSANVPPAAVTSKAA
jgi:pimeloyl-ACP methyl ester carboxylesterase